MDLTKKPLRINEDSIRDVMTAAPVRHYEGEPAPQRSSIEGEPAPQRSSLEGEPAPQRAEN
jgi:hypothetical protein